MMLRLLLFVLCALPLRAATVVLTLTGRVSDTNAGAFFPVAPVTVGDIWTVRIVYDHPSPAIPPGGIGVSIFGDPDGRMDVEVNSLFWRGQGYGMGASVTFDYPFGDQVNFTSAQTVPLSLSLAPKESMLYLNFSGGFDMIADGSSLPKTFADWNLPSASSFSLNLVSDHGPTNEQWFIRANRFDTIRIQVIPEPSAAGFALTIAIAALGRRGRMRA